jgi:hypothetical protein
MWKKRAVVPRGCALTARGGGRSQLDLNEHVRRYETSLIGDPSSGPRAGPPSPRAKVESPRITLGPSAFGRAIETSDFRALP